jgi:dTDP-glucose 4,6-dehydratase
MTGNELIKSMNNSLIKDLEFIISCTANEVWENLRNKRIFLTGGTGFLGKWLLESFIYANDKLNLNSTTTVLSRNVEKFGNLYPHLFNGKGVKFIKGDIRNFNYPDDKFDYIIHAATDVSDKLNKEEPITILDTIIGGTKNILNFAKIAEVKKILNISSGAIYGKQSSEMTHISEEYSGSPSPISMDSAYGEGKRIGELLCTIHSKQFGFESVSARCFAFVGPYLNLNIHYAIGNFIRDGLKGGPIVINGDGTPYRSYLYSSELAIWLWTILIKGKSCQVYNVGSDDAISISDLAKKISKILGNIEIIYTAKMNFALSSPNRYVASIDKVKKELNLKVNISLEEAIMKTIEYYKNNV